MRSMELVSRRTSRSKEILQKVKFTRFFVYEGKNSKPFITGWEYYYEKQISNDQDVEKHIFPYEDKKTGLLVKCFATGCKLMNGFKLFLSKKPCSLLISYKML